MPKVKKVPATLRPYLFHGVDIDAEEGDTQAQGTCPFCGKEKFGVKLETGEFHCFVCGAKGNHATFLRQLWELHKQADQADGGAWSGYVELAEDRKLLDYHTLVEWGCIPSPLTEDWLIPGYGAGGKLDQLYKYIKGYKTGKRLLLATSEIPHALHGVNLYDSDKPIVYLCEGPWDGMVLGEVLALSKRGDRGLTLTGNPAASLAAEANVLAVPGCNVFRDEWLPLFASKRVVLLYDSDHPKEVEGRQTVPAGYAGLQRAVQTLSAAANPPQEISYLQWGPEGYDPQLPSGYDVRDHLTQGTSPGKRVAQLETLLGRVTAIPDSWLGARPKRNEGLTCQECTDWKSLHMSWMKALCLRRDMTDALAVLLAVCLSTDQKGDQLFLQLLADAGSAKTRYCDALLVSKYCFPLEHLTGFHSGWKGDNGEDYSLLARINHCTLITPEGDVLMSSPRFVEIMSQQRRIFDGTSGATYKNSKEDQRYTGLRTPWIIAGTPALMESDQSRLGDRFLRVYIEPPDEEAKQTIVKRVGYTALRSVLQISNGSADGHVEDHMRAAYCLTGGYVDYLRKNSVDLLAQAAAGLDDEAERTLVDFCACRAEFTAYLRARPSKEKDREVGATVELPTRLQHQYVRLAVCLAAVMNRPILDNEVLRIVTKVSLDTARGRTLTTVRCLYEADNEGLETTALANLTNQTEEAERRRLRFLKELGVVKRRDKTVSTPSGKVVTSRRWVLVDRLVTLYRGITK